MGGVKKERTVGCARGVNETLILKKTRDLRGGGRKGKGFRFSALLISRKLSTLDYNGKTRSTQRKGGGAKKSKGRLQSIYRCRPGCKKKMQVSFVMHIQFRRKNISVCRHGAHLHKGKIAGR